MLAHYPVQMRTFLEYHSKKFNLITYKKKKQSSISPSVLTLLRNSSFRTVNYLFRKVETSSFQVILYFLVL